MWPLVSQYLKLRLHFNIITCHLHWPHAKVKFRLCKIKNDLNVLGFAVCYIDILLCLPDCFTLEMRRAVAQWADRRFLYYFSTLFTASTDKTVCCWDYETGGRIKKLKGHQSFVNSCCPSRRGNQMIVSGSDDSTIKVRFRGCDLLKARAFTIYRNLPWQM